jgi:hypothetical protein
MAPPRRTTAGRTPNRRPSRASTSSKTPWSEKELRHSIDTYVLLLRLQIQGTDQKSEPIAQALLSGPLALRNDAAIRYRMRNISAVVREFGVPILIDFSPAESVGSGVRPRIRAMLLENFDFERLLNPTVRSPDEERQVALTALIVLRERVADLEQELSWIGHNNPPDTIGSEEIGREHLRQAQSDIDTIHRELEAEIPDKTSIEQSNHRLVSFAAALAKWVGERFTKFTDAALLAAAPVVVVKVSGLLPAIVNAVEAVARAVAN